MTELTKHEHDMICHVCENIFTYFSEYVKNHTDYSDIIEYQKFIDIGISEYVKHIANGYGDTYSKNIAKMHIGHGI